MHVSVGKHKTTDVKIGQSIQIIEKVDLGYDAFSHVGDISLLKVSSFSKEWKEVYRFCFAFFTSVTQFLITSV